MKEITALDIFKLLGDETRLKIINILASDDSYVELIASKLSLTEATVCYHLKKLEQARIVRSSRSQFYVIYSLNRALFSKPLWDFVSSEVPVIDSDKEYRYSVYARFFKNGRLTALPVQQKKREIVLLRIAADFKLGHDYPETEVNEIIHRYHEDHCTIRREMITFGIMSREREIYRRLK